MCRKAPYGQIPIDTAAMLAERTWCRSCYSSKNFGHGYVANEDTLRTALEGPGVPFDPWRIMVRGRRAPDHLRSQFGRGFWAT